MIREANKNDANVLDNMLSLLVNDERKYDDRIAPFFVVMDYYKNLINKDNNYFYVYEEDNKIVGYIYFKIVNDGTMDKYAKIDALYIDDSYRNKGIASSLIEVSLNKIKELDIKSVEIGVMKNNTIAKKLYLKYGFNEFKETLIKKI